MNKEEIDWIVQNLFVGNRLWSGDGNKTESIGAAFDLRSIKVPVILFASMGDNITPPAQAFNWLADTYHSTEEIKSRGQVIIGLVHQSVGHLGIFVSGKVAKKEHAQIVSVLKSIEMLPPGLYGMHIAESKGAEGEVRYAVHFVEHRLEEIMDRINRFKRADERPFQAVAKVSEFNQRAYDLFAHPFGTSWSNEYTAAMGRLFHPLRFQHWAISDWNPWLAWLGPAADQVKRQRQPSKDIQTFHDVEQIFSEVVSASLDYYRDLRDAVREGMFFQTYGSIAPLRNEDVAKPQFSATDENLGTPTRVGAQVAAGGYAEALSRAGYLLAAKGKPLPLAQFELKKKLLARFGHLMPKLSPDEKRVIRGNQEVICRHDPEKALNTLPTLLANPADHQHFLTVLDAVVQEYSAQFGMTEEQTAMLRRIRNLLSAKRFQKQTDIPISSRNSVSHHE